jgi:hypothetical protein
MNVETMNDEHFDRAVGRAMEQVPLPLGLAERLLATLQSADGQVAQGNRPVEGNRPLAEKNRRFVRRHWLVPASVAAAALVAGVVVYLFREAPAPMDYDAVIAAVGGFHDQEPAAEGEALAGAPPADFPIPSTVVTNSRTRWRQVRKLLGRAGLAYELTSARGGRATRATLYVVDVNSRSRLIVANSMPLSPPNGNFTEGRTMGAWTDGTRLYVLVVEGDDRDYRSFLRRIDRLT